MLRGNPRQESSGETVAGILEGIPTGILGKSQQEFLEGIPTGNLGGNLAGIFKGILAGTLMEVWQESWWALLMLEETSFQFSKEKKQHLITYNNY